MGQVIAEETKAGVELLEDNGLGLNFANLLGDDPFGHLLKNEETLLNNFNGLRVADDLLGRVYHLGEMDRAVKVVDSVEIIEAAEGR
jgi:hypothetical protein